MASQQSNYKSKYLLRCATPFYVKDKTQQDIPVNCGKCPYCKKRRVSSWVFRLLQEEKISFSSYFITLTYNSKTIPITKNGYRNLDKRDYQLFMKRLRKLQKSKIKYYACGEYGEKTFRPHYHAIIFNIEDIEHINTAWQLGKVHIGDVSGASIAYTAKYIDKQKRIPLHQNDDRQPEFSLMSLGLGKNYLTPAIKKYHKSDLSRMYVTLPDNIKVAMPKYYRDRIYNDAEKLKQRLIITQIEADEIEAYRDKFAKSNKNPDLTFDMYMDNLRYARYNNFYNTKNSRKL